MMLYKTLGQMNIIKVSFLVIAFMSVFSSAFAENMSDEAKEGMAFFQGEKRFDNGGPSCLSCHNITNDNAAIGGTFAKDLTDVYSRMGDGIAGWLTAPSFPPMKVAYSDHPLTEKERNSLTVFLKYANNVKDSQAQSNGGLLVLVGGGLVGLVVLLLLFQLIWSKRKTRMVKDDIFARSIKSFDARF